MRARWIPVLLLLAACSKDGVPLLGYQAGDVSESVTVISTGSDDNRRPQDLAFNVQDDSELWVVNKAEDSVTIHRGIGTDDVEVESIIDPFALHFMEKVSSIAWGEGDTFATCQDSRNTYNGDFEPNDFTGPTLWSADPDIFGLTNPDAVEGLSEVFGSSVNLGSHIDMLHESPLCVGIEWDEKNVYWVFDGLNGHIVRYDFKKDHGPGWDDHSDGVVRRFVDTDVERVPGLVSHLVMDQETKLLYVADTGNNRIMVLDTRTGSRGDDLGSFDCWQGECVTHVEWEGADWTELIDGDLFEMEAPTGIELLDGVLYVADAATANLHAFDLEGNEIDRAWTGITDGDGLQGITARNSNELYMVNAKSNEVLQLLGEE